MVGKQALAEEVSHMSDLCWQEKASFLKHSYTVSGQRPSDRQAMPEDHDKGRKPDSATAASGWSADFLETAPLHCHITQICITVQLTECSTVNATYGTAYQQWPRAKFEQGAEAFRTASAKSLLPLQSFTSKGIGATFLSLPRARVPAQEKQRPHFKA